MTKANLAITKKGKHISDSHLIQAGVIVKHEKFGKGKVLQVEGQVDNKKATIFFENFGQKVLLLKFAKLQIIS